MPRQPAASDVFRAVADPTRRAILDLLAGGAQPVRAIAGRFPVSRPAISKHLRILREAGLVGEQPAGRENLYRLEPGPLGEIARWVRPHVGAGAAGPRPAGGAAGREALPPAAPRSGDRARPAAGSRRRRPAPQAAAERQPPTAGEWRVW